MLQGRVLWIPSRVFSILSKHPRCTDIQKRWQITYADNKDLIAKPVLGAIGSLAATGLSDGNTSNH